MRGFLRRQAAYFAWGFAITMVVIAAYKEGLRDLITWVIISAVVGLIVSAAIYLLERRFPESPTDN
jgi:hypothetical protein